MKDKIEFCKYFVYNKIKEKRKKEFHMNKATREKIADDIIKAATAQNVKMSKNYKNGILCVSADEPYELIPLFMIDKKYISFMLVNGYGEIITLLKVKEVEEAMKFIDAFVERKQEVSESPLPLSEREKRIKEEVVWLPSKISDVNKYKIEFYWDKWNGIEIKGYIYADGSNYLSIKDVDNDFTFVSKCCRNDSEFINLVNFYICYRGK